MNDPQTHSENTTTLRRWVVLGGLFMIYMASNGITMHTLPLLYPELIETFGWSATQVTLPATILFVIGAFTSPPAGWLLDRFSPRIIILSGSIIMGVALIFYAQITALWQLVVIYAQDYPYAGSCQIWSYFLAGLAQPEGVLPEYF